MAGGRRCCDADNFVVMLNLDGTSEIAHYIRQVNGSHFSKMLGAANILTNQFFLLYLNIMAKIYSDVKNLHNDHTFLAKDIFIYFISH